jgi:hypothetical protein
MSCDEAVNAAAEGAKRWREWAVRWSRPAPTPTRLRASAARTARPCGESLLELFFQALGRDVVFSLDLDRDLDPDPRGLDVDDVHVAGHVLPV